MKRSTSKQRALQTLWNAITKQAIANNGGRCAVFHEEPATEGHHIHPRGRRGSYTLANCLPVSRRGHDWIRDNKRESVKRGWLSSPKIFAQLSMESEGFEPIK